MSTPQLNLIQATIQELFSDSKFDKLKILKGMLRGISGPITPEHFKDVYLSISKEQGEDLVQLITENKLQNLVEFGTSFGISTLYLAEGALQTGGNITTTELIDSKAQKALENFHKAGVRDIIDLRVGDAVQTLKSYNQPVDLLLLDGWKDLYLAVFEMLEDKFHKDSIIYVDNADMYETQQFLKAVNQKNTYNMETVYGGKVVLIKQNND